MVRVLFEESQTVVSVSNDSEPEEAQRLSVSQAQKVLVQSLSGIVCLDFRLLSAETSSVNNSSLGSVRQP